jgi:XRE family transcriptional regulator, aerobic/anaerobic benzoate catabolism transcriptional regulator
MINKSVTSALSPQTRAILPNIVSRRAAAAGRVSMFLRRLGQQVRQQRRQRQLTIKELAQQTGLSERFIVQLETGQGNIAIGRLVLVAEALEVNLTELLAPAEGTRQLIGLLGLRGAGKTTIGQALAPQLGVPFWELDESIEDIAGLTLTEIFTLHGEAYYRRLEAQAINRLVAQQQPAIVALPGGIVHNSDIFPIVKRHFLTIWLRAQPAQHMQRVLDQGDRRPIANRPNAMGELQTILKLRGPLYEQAEVILDTSNLTVPSVVEKLMAAIHNTDWTNA